MPCCGCVDLPGVLAIVARYTEYGNLDRESTTGLERGRSDGSSGCGLHGTSLMVEGPVGRLTVHAWGKATSATRKRAVQRDVPFRKPLKE
jgi:hypothetical protein